MTQLHDITREIGIDAGHRVPDHGSKCRSVHGHRYTIQATCTGPLAEKGEENGMVLDFGFLKEEMMAEIDAPCDHALILWTNDRIVQGWRRNECLQIYPALEPFSVDLFGKVYITEFVPTAECLARHWFERLAPRVSARTQGRASLTRVRVFETPNCWADFNAGVQL